MVGIVVGFNVGVTLGDDDGMFVGFAVTGDALGLAVTGDALGLEVGDALGLEVTGDALGLSVTGDALVPEVGELLGLEVTGDALGLTVTGDALGILVEGLSVVGTRVVGLIVGSMTLLLGGDVAVTTVGAR